MPALLTEGHKIRHTGAALQFLTMYKCGGSDPISRIVTSDETWVWYATLDRKESCKEWRGAKEHAPANLKNWMECRRTDGYCLLECKWHPFDLLFT